MSKRTIKDSTWEYGESPRGKHHNKTATKTTVSLYLNRKLVEKARNHRLNLSRITEQALSSILDYLETQNFRKSADCSIQGSNPGFVGGGPDRIRTGDLLHVKQMS
jgi:post-segregation antitoxin (ccd killing protein)